MMPSAKPELPQIGIATKAERREALALVFRNVVTNEELPHVERLILVPPEIRDVWQGLFVARRAGHMVGAIFSQHQPGNVALTWFPQITIKEPAATIGQLFAAANDQLTRQKVCLVQCSLNHPTVVENEQLRQAGYHWIANLFYLVCNELQFPQSPPRTPLQFQAYQADLKPRLQRIIEATYRETLDCPALNGVRSIDDVLAGYRASGVFDPHRWLIVSNNQRDVGCLILTAYPDQENWELVYLGVVPEERGQGWGKHIAQHAQWLARKAGRPRIVLAVDAANQPAVRMYTEVGFQAWGQRSVYWKNFSANPSLSKFS